MAKFYYGNNLNTQLENIIKTADVELWFISPYIKLHDRIRDELKRIKEKDDLEIVFGKNENDPSKSLSKDDLDFLKSFPNIKICYEKNLHAKYYANESCGLVTSMNLHQFSQNNNIEAGVLLERKNIISGIVSNVGSLNDADGEANHYFEGVIKNSEVLFEKKPHYEKSIFSKKYTYSKVEVDILDTRFPEPKSDYKNPRLNSFSPAPKITITKEVETGFCIRTGRPIPFNIAKPMSAEAYQSWQQYKNPDYKEKFCHKTGKPSFGKTSMRNPVLV